MDYREWEHESRDLRARGPARPPWSADEDDEHSHHGAYDTPRQRQVSAYHWDREDGWPDPLDEPYEWTSARHADSSQTGTGWTSGRHEEPEDDHYADPRYPSSYEPSSYQAGGAYRYPDDYPAGYPDPPARRWHDGRVLDHDDWYEHPPAAPLPAPRRPAEMVHVPRSTPARPFGADEDEDEDPSRNGYVSAFVAASVWCAIPVVLYVLWALTLGGTPEPNCVDPAGNPCAAPRTEALIALGNNLPRLATAFGLSLALALIVRWSNATWRGATVGFASTVVGAGIATLLFSLMAPR